MRVSPGCLWPFYTHADLSPRTYLFNGSQLAKDIRPLFRDTPDVDSMKEYGLDLSSYVMRDFRCEHACKVLGKRNHEFESNPLRQPVLLFLSLGGVLLAKSILPPKTREYRTDKHRMFVSTQEQACQSAHISPMESRVVAFQKTNSTISSH
jgi:hypothetical protein